jgi:hypothetical protein
MDAVARFIEENWGWLVLVAGAVTLVRPAVASIYNGARTLAVDLYAAGVALLGKPRERQGPVRAT